MNRAGYGLIFVAGAVVGAAGMYAFLRNKLNNELAEEQVDIRNYYENKMREFQDVLVESMNVVDEDLPEEVKSSETSEKTDYTQYAKSGEVKEALLEISEATHAPGLDEHMASMEHPEDDEPEEEPDDSEYYNAFEASKELEKMQEQAKAEGARPHYIYQEDYMQGVDDGRVSYAKCELEYYTDDAILVDENGDEVQNPEEQVGSRQFLERAFGYDQNDPDVAYIRNDQLCVDYCITRIDEAYYPEPEPDIDANISIS